MLPSEEVCDATTLNIYSIAWLKKIKKNFMLHQKKSLHTFFKKIIRSILITLFAANILHAQQIDLLLKGGHVIDPTNKIDEQMDVAIANGKIFGVAKNIPAKNSKQVIDVSGLYVTPGIIDMHVHV